MAIAYSAIGAFSHGTSTSASTAAPAGTASGDLLVLFINCFLAASLTTPSGWTQIDNTGDGFGTFQVATFYRIADGSASDTPTVAVGASQAWMTRIVRVTGNSATPLDVHGVTCEESQGSPAIPSVTTAVATELALAVVLQSRGDIVSFTSDPSGWTMVADDLGDVSSFKQCEWRVYWKTYASAGSAGGDAATLSSAVTTGQTIATFEPVGGGGGTTFTKSLTAAVSFAGAQAKTSSIPVSGALTFSGTQAKITRRSLPAGLTFVGSCAHRLSRSLVAAALTFSGGVTKQTNKAVAGSLSFTGAMSRVISALLVGALTFTGNINRSMTRALTAALTFSGAMAKRTAMSLLGAVSFAGSIATQKITLHLQTLTAALSFTGAFQKQTDKALPASLSFTGGIARLIAHGMSAVLAPVGTLTKRTSRGLIGALGFAGVLNTTNPSVIITFIQWLFPSLVAGQFKNEALTVGQFTAETSAAAGFVREGLAW